MGRTRVLWAALWVVAASCGDGSKPNATGGSSGHLGTGGVGGVGGSGGVGGIDASGGVGGTDASTVDARTVDASTVDASVGDAREGDGGACAPSGIGDGCTVDATGCDTAEQGSCAAGQFCIPAQCMGQDTGFAGGYCISMCPCPCDSVCDSQMGASFCFKGCSTDADCRAAEGYTCQGGTCIPAGGGGP